MNCYVIHDPTATGYDRWTCETCNKAIVRQPWMTNSYWATMKYNFIAEHTKEDVESEPEVKNG